MQSTWLEHLSCSVLGRWTGNDAIMTTFDSLKSMVTGGPHGGSREEEFGSKPRHSRLHRFSENRVPLSVPWETDPWKRPTFLPDS